MNTITPLYRNTQTLDLLKKEIQLQSLYIMNSETTLMPTVKSDPKGSYHLYRHMITSLTNVCEVYCKEEVDFCQYDSFYHFDIEKVCTDGSMGELIWTEPRFEAAYSVITHYVQSVIYDCDVRGLDALALANLRFLYRELLIQLEKGYLSPHYRSDSRRWREDFFNRLSFRSEGEGA
jgi:hypothetical protein